MFSLSRHALLALGASTIALFAAPATAQSGAAEATNVGDEPGGDIVVTAQRREQNANDVPVTIQAFSGDQLRQQRVTNIADLSTIAPSFTITPTGQGVPNYYIRGIGFNTVNQSATSTVGTYVDEVAYSYPLMNTGPIYDLERVEVLKGPQGTLFGRNTTAGLIDFVTAKPSDTFGARLVGEVGNFGTHNIEGMVTGALADGIQARLAFRTEDSDDGWQRSLSSGDRLGEVHRYGIRASLAAQPAPGLTIDLSYSYWRNRSDTLAGQAIAFTPTSQPGSGAYAAFNAPGLADFVANNPPRRAQDADWAPYDVRATDLGTRGQPGFGPGLKGDLQERGDFHAGKLRIGYELADGIDLISLTGYNRLERKALNDNSAAPFELFLFENKARITSASEELRLEGSTGRVNWLLGGYYAHDRLYDSAISQEGNLAPINLVRFLTTQLLAAPINTFGYTLADVQYSDRAYRDSARFRTTTWSIFGNVDWHLSDTFTVTGALRYTKDDQRFRGCTSDYEGSLVPIVNLFNRSNWAALPSSNGVPPAPIGINQCNSYLESINSFGYFNSRIAEDNVAWRIAPQWTPTDDVLVYASASRGYKSGSTPVLAATRAEQNTPARQEELTAYEVGAKLGALDRRVQVNAAFFYYDYRDKQAVAGLADPVYTVLNQLQNIPRSEAYGIDTDITIRPARGVSFVAAGTWLKTKVLEWETIGNTGATIDASGSGFAYSPRFTGSLSVLVDRPINDRLAFVADATLRHQSSSNAGSEEDPLYAIPAYSVLNGSIGVRTADDRWRLSVWARNLTDEYYWTQVTSNSNLVYRYAGQPRTFGATLAFSY
jgi:iron complex outermembrane receptor protein